MLTYQVRPRVFRLEGNNQPVWPASCDIRFHFRPPQPFGVEPGGGRTVVRAVAARAVFNANNGDFTVKSSEPLTPLEVIIEEHAGGVTLRLTGQLMVVTKTMATLKELTDFTEGIYFSMPLLLNIPFADPPYVERVDGMIGTVRFRWELSEWRMGMKTTTQEQQETAVAAAWDQMQLLAAPHRRRLIAGLHHFHIACRLARKGDTAGEFLAEVVLNLAKTLEVLFPPSGDGKTRDAVRAALKLLGFSEYEIEGNFIPAMALRNEIDVAHVELGLFKMEQLRIIHAFVDRAEGAFRDMFERLLRRIEAGQFDVPAYEVGSARSEAAAVIDRLRDFTRADQL